MNNRFKINFNDRINSNNYIIKQNENKQTNVNSQKYISSISMKLDLYNNAHSSDILTPDINKATKNNTIKSISKINIINKIRKIKNLHNTNLTTQNNIKKKIIRNKIKDTTDSIILLNFDTDDDDDDDECIENDTNGLSTWDK
jgi:hypothetical protein